LFVKLSVSAGDSYSQEKVGNRLWDNYLTVTVVAVTQ